MHTNVYHFTLTNSADLAEAEATLHLAILAAEGLFGEARVRMEASYHLDAPRAALLVDGSTPVGDAVVRIFTTFLTREFGPDAFAVRRVSATPRSLPAHMGGAGRPITGAAA